MNVLITQKEGIPNVEGVVGFISDFTTPTKQFYPAGGYALRFGAAEHIGGYNVGLDASRTNSCFGSSDHVTPCNTSLRLWKRTA